MSNQDQQKTGKIPLKSFLADFRSSLTDADLRKKYRLSAAAFISLIRALLAKGLINSGDLARRKELAVQRDLEKQSEFLSGLYICPNCNHPHPSPFEKCPACGAEPGNAFAARELPTPVVSTTGTHFLVGDHEDVEDVDDPEVVLDETSDADTDVRESPDDEERKAGTKDSPLKSVRSLFSKLKKK
ncbi:MAG: hypothetical protein RDU20_16850 [Desulfomonilaceae bacterium]|nr:hypothetical protein [Desulfomonilaceae bacterium]